MLSVAAIAWLTLRPAPAIGVMPFTRFCLKCGPTGTADFGANVLLFVPLGAGLALAGLRWRWATLAAMAYTGAIEFAQLTVVTGRYAMFADVVSNSIGGALGAAVMIHRRRWLRPSARGAAVLGAAAGFAFLAVLAASAWTLVLPDDAASTPPRATPGAAMPGSGWFAGWVQRAAIGDFVAANPAPGPMFVAAPPRRTLVAEVQVLGRSRGVTAPSPILVVHAPDAGPERAWLVIGQRGQQFTLAAGDRARRLGVRQPVISLGARPLTGVRRAVRRGLLTDSQASALLANRSDRPYTLRARYGDNHLAIHYLQGAAELERSSIRVAPTLGWALLSPLPRLESPLTGLATALWLAGLALPMGYFAAWAVRGGRLTRLVATTGIASTVVAGLAVVPLAWEFSVGRWWEWIATLGGVAAGVAAAELVRRFR